MTVGELRELLEQYDDATEVRLMTQSAWPFENAVHGVVSAQEIADDDEPDDEDLDEPVEPVVYICEGTQLKYGTKSAWELARRYS